MAMVTQLQQSMKLECRWRRQLSPPFRMLAPFLPSGRPRWAGAAGLELLNTCPEGSHLRVHPARLGKSQGSGLRKHHGTAMAAGL